MHQQTALLRFAPCAARMCLIKLLFAKIDGSFYGVRPRRIRARLRSRLCVENGRLRFALAALRTAASALLHASPDYAEDGAIGDAAGQVAGSNTPASADPTQHQRHLASFTTAAVP